jgi:acrylyl-CoA reductase (NADPH)
MKALRIDKEPHYQCQLVDVDEATFNTDLSTEGDVWVDVAYSSINYKDGLAITGKSPVVRKPTLIPGIDFVGQVCKSEHPRWQVGDAVILNGWGVGEVHSGGLAQQARVKGDWLIAKPAGITPKQAMAIGTAGYTAMLCVMALQTHGVRPDAGEILVTGASGGVGSVAVALLAQAGYRVVAATGKENEHAYLTQLGAAEIMPRQSLSEPGKPLQKERWAGVVDSVGSHTLANACASARYGAVVAACGLAQGMDFPATVAPFILRGVTLCGVDSVMAPLALREAAWGRLAESLATDWLEALTTVVPLAGAIDTATAILKGQVRGRVVVDVNA